MRAIVIGSGVGGLSAAIRLAAMGLQVLVLEKLPGPGGRAFVHRAEGFTFDMGPTVITVPPFLEDLFTIPASAEVTGVVFKAEAKAKAFREAALRGGDLQALAKAQEGTVTEYGTVSPNQLPAVLDRLVFKVKETFPKGPMGEVSEVVKLEDGTFAVLLVKNRKPEVLKPFNEVVEEAKERVILSKRQQKGQALVQELRKAAKIENRLSQVLAELTPKTQEPAKPPTQEAPKEAPAKP